MSSDECMFVSHRGVMPTKSLHPGNIYNDYYGVFNEVSRLENCSYIQLVITTFC